MGDGDRTTPSPGGGPGGESFVSFCFCSAAGPAASGTQNFNKRAVSSVSGSQEEESGVPCITGSLPSSSLARQWGVAQEHPSCPFVEPGKGSSTQAPATSRHTQAGLLCFPTTGTSVTPLVLLAWSLGAWLALPSPTRWLLRTIRLGYAMYAIQRARSIRGLDGSPTAFAYQLPRVASSTPCPEPSQRAPSAQGRSGPYGQHCDHCVYQPARRFTLPSHVATRPPPPPLESEASEVPSCHPHPMSVQSGSRRAVSGSTSRRVKTPSPGGSADLGTVWSCSGRPVCISRNHPLPGVLLPNRGNARHGCTGTQLAPRPALICVPPSEPTSTDTVQDQGGRGAGLVSGSILAQKDLVPGTHAPRDSPSLANSSEEGSAFSETGHPMAPASGPVETPRILDGTRRF